MGHDGAVDDDFAYLTTTGRVSGRPHRIEIWYERHGDTLWMLAGDGHGSDWVRNLDRDRRCRVALGADGLERSATGRFPGGDEARAARDAVFAKYRQRGHGDLSSWREAALVVAIDLSPDAEGGG